MIDKQERIEFTLNVFVNVQGLDVKISPGHIGENWRRLKRSRISIVRIINPTSNFLFLQMLGDRGEKPLLNTLTRNKDRRIYLQNAFHNIFEETISREWLNPDLLAVGYAILSALGNYLP